MSKSKLLKFLLPLALLAPLATHAQVNYAVNDTFSDTDRIGGSDGSSTTAIAPTISTASATNTQWVVSRLNQMVASASGQLWTQDTTSSTMAIGYFPDVTVASGVPVTLTLNFTTGAAGATANNLRIALVNGTPSGFRTTDGVSTGSDATHVNDVGYGIFSATSIVGGGNTTDLVLRTYKRIVTTSQALLSTAGDWGGTLTGSPATNTGPLAFSSGSTGNLAANTSYSLQVVLAYDGTTLTITTALSGGNLTGLSYVATDASTPTTTFNEIAIRLGGGSAQFASINLTKLTVTTPLQAPSAPTATAASGTTSAGFAANWSAATGATGYRLDVSTDNAFGTFVTGYQDLDVGNVLTSSVTGLSANTAYYYRVRAYNGAGASTSSNTIAQTTLAAAPAAPTATAASGTTATGFSANWTSNDAGATGYRLDVSTDNGFGSFVSGYQDKDVGNVTTSSITGLTASTTYYYRVRAYNGTGASTSSNIVSATTSSSGPTTISILHDSFAAATANGGLTPDSNSLLAPTSTQAVWASFGTGNFAYTQNTSIGVSAGGTRGLIAYFEPSTSLATLAVGETLSASFTFKFTGGTLAENAGNFRIGLFNSGGNGTASNIGGAARYASGTSNSLTGTPTGNTARGYAGYIVDSKAASTTSTDTLSFWFRTAATTSGGGSTQIAGPTSTDLIASSTFSQLSANGGGTVSPILNDGSTLYTATFTIKYVSATQVDLAYTVTSGASTVMSYAYSQTSGTLVTSFDSLMIFSTYGAAPSITDLNIIKLVSNVPAPTITTQPSPASQTVNAGSNVTYSVAATGTGPFTYQWKKGGTNVADATSHIAGSTTDTLSLTNVQGTDAGSYTVVVTGAGGSVTSNAATLGVTVSGPTIVTQPQSQSALLGTRATFSVFATGTGTLTYQWNKAGNPISGATSQTLTLTNLQSSDAASYTVTVTDSNGPTTSVAGVLTVLTPAATLPTQPTIPAGVFKVTDYGAIGDGTTDNTTFIQAAITAAQTAGGGTIELPPAAGAYITGPITLRSSMNLQIDGGATLRALPRTNYPNYLTTTTDLITVASSATNVAITGTGTIEGDGSAWWTAYNANSSIDRPRLIQFTKATNVLISGITLQNSPQFHIAMSGSGGTGNTNVTICGITITAPSTSPNTDGIDPTGTNILIQSCNIAVGDDNIAIKAQNGACGNLTIDSCTFGVGHGLSIGGQTNYGLDGLTVTNCTFTGTTSGLRLKADPTQGGLVQNLSYSNITMTNVQYPIVFYSYYNQVGTPGATSGSNQTTVAKVLSTNATPPNPLNTSTLPVWKNITISNLTATGASGYSTIWGLPLASGLIANVTLNNVSIAGGPGLEIYNATNVQLTGTTTATSVGPLTTANSLTLTSQPSNQTVNTTDPVNLAVTAVGTSGSANTVPTYQWNRNGTALTNGTQSNGTVIAGATTAALSLTNSHPGDSGSYTCTVSNTLDGYNTGTSSLAANSLPVSATSAAATVTVNGTGTVPVITTQPTSVVILPGASASFTVVATSDTPLTYQWKHDSTALTDTAQITGTHSATLAISNAQAADAGTYTVVLTNGSGATTSDAATLSVTVPPTVTQQPVDKSVYVGDTVSFTVVVSGSSPFSFLWKKDGVSLDKNTHFSGVYSTTLTLAGAQLTDSGTYALEISNAAGLINSSAATLLVSPVPTAPLAPVANAATTIDATSFVASWNSSLDATGYLLDVSTSSSFATYLSGYQNRDVGAALSQTVTGLKPLTAYYYRVRAKNSVGASPNSNSISVTTHDTTSAPTFTSASGTTFTVGLASSFTVTATGKPVPTVAASGLPSWVTFNAATGLLSGTAPTGTASGQFVINFSATNGTAPDASQVFTLTVQAAPGVGNPMTITTIAGLAGTSGTTDDTGSAARFAHPSDVAVDAAGNVYVTDTDNHTIRRITPAGVVALFAGQAGTSGSTNGAAAVARFNLPSGITIDNLGNLYVSDTMNHTVRRITTSGTVSLIAGGAGTSGSTDGTGSAARFFAPQGLAVSADRNTLYVADTNNHTIRKIDLTTSAVTTFAGVAGQAGSADGVGNGARFNAPSDIAIDQAGNLYVADTDNNTIRTVTAAGAVTTLAGLPGSSGAADGTGSAARFNHPSAVVVDDAYNVFVLDTDNHAIRQIVSAAGVVTTVAGQAGASGNADGSGAAARFNYPTGIAVSATGAFFIADTNNHTIRGGTFSSAPVITRQPQGTTVSAGGTVQLFVTATGQPAPTYKWLLNGAAVAGATTDTLTLSNAQPSQSGKYSVTVTNSQGSVTSNEATVTINASVPPSGSTGGGGGGGGGGAPSAWFYLALLALAAARLVTSRRASKKLSSSSAS